MTASGPVMWQAGSQAHRRKGDKDMLEITGYYVRFALDGIIRGDKECTTKSEAIKFAVRKNLQGFKSVVFEMHEHDINDRIFPVTGWYGAPFRRKQSQHFYY